MQNKKIYPDVKEAKVVLDSSKQHLRMFLIEFHFEEPIEIQITTMRLIYNRFEAFSSSVLL